MSDKIPARFRKTKTDKWAVMAPVEDLEKALADGGKVDVLKKSGDWSTFQVVSLGRPFDVDGVKMCYGYSDADDGEAARGDGGGGGAGGGSADGGRSASSVPAPRRDDTEPIPEYQGGPEDEWSDF